MELPSRELLKLPLSLNFTRLMRLPIFNYCTVSYVCLAFCQQCAKINFNVYFFLPTYHFSFAPLLQTLETIAWLILFFGRIPESQDISFGELKQGKKCLDTLGSQAGGSVGMFDCHGQAGNQVLVLSFINCVTVLLLLRSRLRDSYCVTTLIFEAKFACLTLRTF